MSNGIKLVLIALTLVWSTLSLATPRIYRVGVMVQPPFAYAVHGSYFGVSVDIWHAIANEAGFEYKFVKEYKNSREAIAGLQHDHLDAIIGPLSVNSQYVRQVDYSRPYYISQIAIASTDKQENFWRTIASIVNTQIAISILALFAISILFAIVAYYVVTIRTKHDTSPEKKSFLTCLYEATISFITTNPILLDKPILRILQVIAMLASLLLVSIFVGVITSALTVESTSLQLSNRPTQVALIHSNSLVARAGSYAYNYASRLGANIQTTPTFDQAADLVMSKKAKYLIGNHETIAYYIQTHKTDLRIIDPSMTQNEFSFIFPKHSTLTDPVNYALLSLQERDDIVPICSKYLTEDSDLSKCQL